MNLFTAILLGALIVLSFGKDSVVRADTTFIGNTVKVEIQSATKQADDDASQRRHDESMQLQRGNIAAASSMMLATWALASFAFLAFIFSFLTFRISRRQSKQESRAYIAVSLDGNWHEEHIVGDYRGLLITPTIKNLGRTPAMDVAFSGTLDPVPCDSTLTPMLDSRRIDVLRNPNLLIAVGNIGPDKVGPPTPVEFALSEYERYKDELVDAKNPDGTIDLSRVNVLCYYGIITYTNSFDERWETFFAWKLSWLESERKFFPLQIQPHGKEASSVKHYSVFRRGVRFFFG